jgi:TolA-binding protein
LGECCAALSKWDESRLAFEAHRLRFSASELWFQSQFGIGWALENQGELDAAISAYRAVVDGHNGATAARAQFQIGECLFAQKSHEEAVRELLKVDILYAYPEWSAAALYEAGRCLEAMARPSEARTQFEQVQQRFSESKWAALAAKRLASASAAPASGG